MNGTTFGFSAAVPARKEVANEPVILTVAPHRYTKAYRIYTAIKGFVDSFKGYMERRATVNQLRALSDRELADIGLARGTILSTVEELYAEKEAQEAKSFKPTYSFLSSSKVAKGGVDVKAGNHNKAVRAA